MAIPAGFDVNNPACPVCNGRVYDNRETKRNPRAPDWKCRDKSCDGAVWLDKKPAQGQRQAPQQQAAQPVQMQPGLAAKSWQPSGYRGQPLTKDRFWGLQREFFDTAIFMVREATRAGGLTITDVEIAELAQDFTAQAMIGVERNVLTLGEAQPSAATETALGEAAAGYVQTLAICGTSGDCDGVRNMFMADDAVKPEERQELLKQWMERKKALAKGGAS